MWYELPYPVRLSDVEFLPCRIGSLSVFSAVCAPKREFLRRQLWGSVANYADNRHSETGPTPGNWNVTPGGSCPEELTYIQQRSAFLNPAQGEFAWRALEVIFAGVDEPLWESFSLLSIGEGGGGGGGVFNRLALGGSAAGNEGLSLSNTQRCKFCHPVW